MPTKISTVNLLNGFDEGTNFYFFFLICANEMHFPQVLLLKKHLKKEQSQNEHKKMQIIKRDFTQIKTGLDL